MLNIEYSGTANEDMRELFYFIAHEKGMLITAKNYLQGLKEKIEFIADNPTAFAITHHNSLLKYGLDVRRANYKKMAIIYSIIEYDTIYIHRVVSANMITGL